MYVYMYVYDIHVYTVLVMKLPHVYAVHSQCTLTPCPYHPVDREKKLQRVCENSAL